MPGWPGATGLGPLNPPPPERRLVVLPGGTEMVEGVVAYRAWGVQVDRGLAQLTSCVMARHLWPVGAPVEAACLWQAGALRSEHLAPHTGCDCGLYGFASPWAALREFNQRIYVHGEVILYGIIKVHGAGYRAQYAVPAALWQTVPGGSAATREAQRRVASMVATAYDIPLVQAPLPPIKMRDDAV